MGFTNDDKYFIKWLSVSKNCKAKHLLKMLFDAWKSRYRVKKLQENHCVIFNFAYFCSGVTSVWSTVCANVGQRCYCMIFSYPCF